MSGSTQRDGFAFAFWQTRVRLQDRGSHFNPPYRTSVWMRSRPVFEELRDEPALRRARS